MSLTFVSSLSFTWFHPVGIKHYGPLAFEVFIYIFNVYILGQALQTYHLTILQCHFFYIAAPFGCCSFSRSLSPLQPCCFAWKCFSLVLWLWSAVFQGFPWASNSSLLWNICTFHWLYLGVFNKDFFGGRWGVGCLFFFCFTLNCDIFIL